LKAKLTFRSFLRKFPGIDLEQKYLDQIAIPRLNDELTGKKPLSFNNKAKAEEK
jgi:hypothetical protein